MNRTRYHTRLRPAACATQFREACPTRLAWLKRQGSGYQTRINKLLREAMEGKRRA